MDIEVGVSRIELYRSVFWTEKVIQFDTTTQAGK